MLMKTTIDICYDKRLNAVTHVLNLSQFTLFPLLTDSDGNHVVAMTTGCKHGYMDYNKTHYFIPRLIKA